jgi:signal recognition particle subunit SRP54
VFDSLSDRLDGIFSKLRSRGRLTERDVDEISREIRLALLEADVNGRVVKSFIGRVKARAVGVEVSKALDPGQQFIKIVHEELVETLGGTTGKLTMSPKPPTVLMLAGLQGSGKTTAAAKLARLLKSQGLHPLLVGADLQRPAAVEQLRVLSGRVDVPFYSEATDTVSDARGAPLRRARRAPPRPGRSTPSTRAHRRARRARAAARPRPGAAGRRPRATAGGSGS